jgi:hypothetical protein
MSEENGNSTKTTGIKFFLVLAFVAIVFLCYKNYELNQKLEFCNKQLEYYSELSEEFHKNLYASQTGSYSQGTHTLSISDVYYQKYFNTNDKEK